MSQYNCIVELKLLRKEIEVIKPTHIIFYTSKDYDTYFRNIFDEFTILTDTKKNVGKKTMPWLEADAKVNRNVIKILRTGHPERKKKQDFVNSIVQWIL